MPLLFFPPPLQQLHPGPCEESFFGLLALRSLVSLARRIDELTIEIFGAEGMTRGAGWLHSGHSHGSEKLDIGRNASNGPQVSQSYS